MLNDKNNPNSTVDAKMAEVLGCITMGGVLIHLV